MLVLARNIGETLVIDKEIEITILDSTRYKVRLGIDAPKAVKVHRKEIYLKEAMKQKTADREGFRE
ncbi:MAG: carbon storage regulator CsrA [Gammaproteobacteria bacterium]|nr:carbon storage regulator CsrA [Gammaproteobacteria bacterium]